MSEISYGITMAETLMESRQKSIADFMISGGKHSSSQRKEFASIQLNPRVHCHPLHNVLSKNRKIRVDIKDSIGDICCSRLQETYLIGGSASQNNHRDVIRNLSLVSFDNDGVLFIVCGANGQIRVFDFDECVASMVLDKSDPVVPLVRIDARKDIAHVCWSVDCPDEIAVCFSYFSQVYVYNLNQKDLSFPLKTLEVGFGGGEGGHHTCVYWSKKQQELADSSKDTFNTSSSNKKEYMSTLIVGSKSGHLRCWQLNRNTKKCAWNMIADPVMIASNAVTVVGLLILHDGGTLLSATASGVFVLWDLLHCQVSTMGTNPCPTSLCRISSGDLALYAYPSVELVSIAVRPTVNPIHHQAVEPEVILMTLSNGAVHLLDLFQECLLTSVQATKSFGSEVRTVIPRWPHGSGVCVACNGSSLEVLPLHTPCQRMAVNQHRAAVLLGPDHDRPSSSSAVSLYDSWTVKSNANLLRHCMEVGHTLPGKIISAEPGELRVTTSHDLQMYLKVNGVVWFDWSASGVDSTSGEAGKTEVEDDLVGDLEKLEVTEEVSKHTVDGVISHRIALHQPYSGPAVAKGHPLVFIRTNLTPGKRVDPDTPISSGGGSVVTVAPIASVKLSFQCTALSCHPTLPYLVAGAEDGTVHILSPMGRSECIPADSITTSTESEVSVKSEGSLLLCEIKQEESVMRGNHVNVWMRKGLEGDLVSISKTEHSEVSLRLALAADTAAAIAASLEETAQERDGEIQEEEEGVEEEVGVTLPSEDWYEAIYREVIMKSVEEKLQNIADTAPLAGTATSSHYGEGEEEFMGYNEDTVESWEQEDVATMLEEAQEEEGLTDRGSPLLVDCPNWRSSGNGSSSVQRPNQCSISRQCEEQEVIDLENDPPNKEEAVNQQQQRPSGVFSIFANQAKTSTSGSNASTRPQLQGKLNFSSLEKSQVKLLKGHKSNTLTTLIKSKTSGDIVSSGSSSLTTSSAVLPAKRKAVSSFDVLNTAQASKSSTLAPTMAGSFGSIMRDKTNKSILQSSILASKPSAVATSGSTSRSSLSSARPTSSAVPMKTFATTLKPGAAGSNVSLLKSGGKPLVVRASVPPPTIGSLFHSKK